jgi:hypothetical protein
MTSFICLTDPDRRSERFIRVDHISVVQHIKVGNNPSVNITFIGGENLKLVDAEADQFLASFATMVQGQAPRQDGSTRRLNQPT